MILWLLDISYVIRYLLVLNNTVYKVSFVMYISVSMLRIFNFCCRTVFHLCSYATWCILLFTDGGE